MHISAQQQLEFYFSNFESCKFPWKKSSFPSVPWDLKYKRITILKHQNSISTHSELFNDKNPQHSRGTVSVFQFSARSFWTDFRCFLKIYMTGSFHFRTMLAFSSLRNEYSAVNLESLVFGYFIYHRNIKPCIISKGVLSVHQFKMINSRVDLRFGQGPWVKYQSP